MIVTSPVDELRTWTRGQVEAVSKGWWVLLACQCREPRHSL